MRRSATRVFILIGAACAMTVLAQVASAVSYPLLTGTYGTLNGTIQAGRATESMPSDGAEGLIGNTIWAESWNGAVLGGNWKLTCMKLDGPPTLIYDGLVGGNGQRIYATNYSGGSIWLSGTGAWAAGGAPYYTGTLTMFKVTTTKQFVAGTQVGAVDDINFAGMFEGAGQCFAMNIANADLVGMTGSAFLPPPGGVWPAFHGPSDCAAIGSHGNYWSVHDLTLIISGDCLTPDTPATWGRIKSLYR
jgi:hypothetical protein